MNCEQIARVERLKRPKLGCCARNFVRLRGELESFVQPLGWSFGSLVLLPPSTDLKKVR